MAEKRYRKKTIIDIAEEAGVSIATVSRVLNNSPKVDYDTRLRIQGILKKRHYRPKVVKNKIFNIGILININPSDIFFLSSYHGRIIEGVVDYVYKNNLSMTIIPFDQHLLPYPEEIATYLMEKDISGAVFVNPAEDAPFVYSLDRIDFPYTCISSKFNKGRINCIDVDNFAGITSAVEYLAALNHRKIGFLNPLTPKDTLHAHMQREQAFRQAMQAGNLPLGEKNIMSLEAPDENHKRVGYHLIMHMITQNQELPTALMCLNDDIAIGAIKGLAEKGLKVPNDISVIGFDDYPESEFFLPGLTTIKSPMHEMGYLACEHVERGIKGYTEKLSKILTPQLIIRDSCRAI